MEQIKIEEQNIFPFEMLEELLWQDQFELIFDESESDYKEGYVSKKADLFRKGVNVQQELRLVYLMNDAVESFLVFINAKMNGQYQPDYEG